MPYNYDPNQDPNQQNQQGGQASQAPQLAGGSQVVGGAAATAAPSAPSSAAGGNTYQNLQNYLSANQDNGFGGQFAGKVQGDVDAATQAQQGASQGFKNQSDAGSYYGNNSLIDQAIANPTQFSQDQGNVTNFQNQLNAKYQGPQSLQDDQGDYQKAAGATQKAQDVTQAAQSEAGRFGLLNNYFGNSGYTQGQQGLDQLLVSQDKTAQQGIQQAAQNAAQQQQNFQNMQGDLVNYAGQNKAKTEAAANYAKTQGTNAIAAQNTANQNALTQAQQAYQQEQANLAALQGTDASKWAPLLQQYGVGQAAATNDVIPGVTDQASYYGINPGAGNPTLGLTPTLSNVTSQADQAKLNALENLMQQTQTTFTPGEAGTFNPNLNFDTGAYNTALQGAQQGFQQAEAKANTSTSPLNGQTFANILQDYMAGNLHGNVGATGTSQDLAIESQLQKINPVRQQYGLAPITLAQLKAAPGYKQVAYNQGGGLQQSMSDWDPNQGTWY